jgi:autophagy-related protein 9
MMASNLLSRLLPSSAGSPSIYEALRKHDESTESDVEDRAGMSVDEENLGGGFQDYELDHTDGAGMEDSRMTSESTASLLRRDLEQAARQDGAESTNPRWMASSAALQDALADAEDGDDEVPASLLVEGNDIPLPSRAVQGPVQPNRLPEIQPIPGNSTRETREQWHTTQGQQPLYQDDRPAEAQRHPLPIGHIPFGVINRQDKAEWRWANVQNLDNFLKEVYEYFLMNGFRSILLSRLLNLLYVPSCF